jgi:type I restriction enzyme R subunit
MINETQLEEELCLKWFESINWETINEIDIAPDSSCPERSTYDEVLLRNTLKTSIGKINPQIPSESIDEIITRLRRPESLDLISNNKEFHKLLLEGLDIRYKVDDEIIDDKVFLIDFENIEINSFKAVNQFTVKGTKQHRRPDIVCFINGLPLFVIELKSPSNEEVDIWDAFTQLQTYKNEVSDLFIFNEALVISDGVNARVGSLTANEERFTPWKTIKDENDKPNNEWQLETLVKGFFNKELILDYIRYFIIYETDEANRTIKKIAAYHQFHAVREAVKATIIASGAIEKEKSRALVLRSTVEHNSKKAGVIWHTQGSGKSISMSCYAGKLIQQKEMNNPTLVIVTDRNDLDGQLYTTFCNSKSLFKQEPKQANDRDRLREALAEREAGGIIFTTIQKFAVSPNEEKHPVLNNRNNIVVISDEAHRSQYGLNAKLNSDKGVYQYGYAKHLRDAIPNATFIGFTGTPIALKDKDTRAIFGDYISIYDIKDAVEDGATVQIYYEPRLTKLDLNNIEIENLASEFEDIPEDEEDLDSREKAKIKWSRLEKLVGSKPRLEKIAQDLVKHYENREDVISGKAMIVAMSREICVNLYNEIIKLRPEWHSEDIEKGAIKIIMTGSASDKADLQKHVYNKSTRKRLEERFKDPADNLKLVIVRDMWLTGFDVPCCMTMYVDKPMKGHNLMQAIARVNRVFKDKKGGLVVDYIGIINELKEAYKTYTDSHGKGEATHDIEAAFMVLKEKLETIRAIFTKSAKAEGFNYSNYKTQAKNILIPAANYILGLEDGKKRFLDLILEINIANSLCSTLEKAKELKEEIAFYNTVKAIISKLTNVDKKRKARSKESTLKQILDNAIIADEVMDLYALCGIDKPNIGLLDEEFLQEIKDMPHHNLAVELLEKLLGDHIKAKLKNNLIKQKKYSERLLDTLRRYHQGFITNMKAIEELMSMAKDCTEDAKYAESIGLTNDELAFFDALNENASAKDLGDETLKMIAKEITEKLRKSTTVDWQKRESIRSRLKIIIRRTLQKYKYPPDKTIDAIELVMKQAEILANDWSDDTN